MCLECNKSLSNKEEIAFDRSLKNKDVFCNLPFCTGFYYIYTVKKEKCTFLMITKYDCYLINICITCASPRCLESTFQGLSSCPYPPSAS